jgi:hypothetical protein
VILACASGSDPNENGLNVLASHSFGDHDTGTSMVSSLGDPRFAAGVEDNMNDVPQRDDLSPELQERIR